MIYKNKVKKAGVYPRLKMSTSEKIRDYGSELNWGIEYMLSIDSGNRYMFNYNEVIHQRFQTNLAIVEKGIFNSDYLNTLLTPYLDKTIKLPADPENYDLISNKIQTIVGENLARPFDFIVVNDSATSSSAYAQHESELLMQFTEQLVYQELSQYYQIDQQGQMVNSKGEPIKTIEQLQKYAKYTYSDMAEKIGNLTIKNVLNANRLRYLFAKGNIRQIATGIEVYWVGVINGRYEIRNVNPMNFDYDLSDEEDLIHKSAFCKEIRYLTISDILDEFQEFLDDEDVEYLQDLDLTQISINTINTIKDPFDSYNSYDNTHIRVVHFEWKAFRNIGIMTIPNEFGAPQKVLVSDDTKLSKEEKKLVEFKWVNEVWEGVRIGDECFVRVRPIPNQYQSFDDLSKVKSHYVGMRWKYPLIEKLIPWQKLYNTVLLHLKVAMAAAGTKGFMFDDNAIPRDKGWTPDRYIHYAKTVGMVPFVRPANQSPQGSNSTPIVPYDMTLGDTINNYIKQADFIVSQMGLVSGISPSREGQLVSNSTWGEAERSVAQSSAITQLFQIQHDESIRLVLQAILDYVPEVYSDGDGIYYTMNDMERNFIKFNPDLDFSKLGVNLSNSPRDIKILEQLRILIGESFRQGSITAQSLITSMRSNSISELERIFELEQELKQKEQQQQQQNQMQLQQQQQEYLKEVESMKFQLEQSKVELDKLELQLKEQDSVVKKQIADERNITDIEIAKIRGESVVAGYREDLEIDKDSSGRPDFIELLNKEMEKIKNPNL